ncbi:unnamed protein product, partial [Brassica oleracea]
TLNAAVFSRNFTVKCEPPPTSVGPMPPTNRSTHTTNSPS